MKSTLLDLTTHNLARVPPSLSGFEHFTKPAIIVGFENLEKDVRFDSWIFQC
jgi:hypothetical protein